MPHTASFLHSLRDRLVSEKDFGDLSHAEGLAGFPLIGVRASAGGLDSVACREADGLTEGEIASICDEFFGAVQRLAREAGTRRGRAQGLVAFLFDGGCTEATARFIAKQSRVAHRGGSAAVTVAWAIDLKHARIHTHDNPVSILPPLVVLPQAVYPRLEWLEAAIRQPGDDPPDALKAGPRGGAAGPPADVTRILFLSANCQHSPLDLEREIRQIQQDLRMARSRDALEFRYVPAVTIDSFMQAMLDETPTIVHFAGHGGPDGILVRDELGSPFRLDGEALAALFEAFRDGPLKCVVLNACSSEPPARAIRRHVPNVIGARTEILDETAMAFSAGFYKAIGAGRDIAEAFDLGRTRVKMQRCGGEEDLVLL